MRPLAEWAPGAVPRMRAAGVFVTPELGDTVLADPALAPLAALPDGVQSPSDLRYLTRVNLSRGVDVVKTRANPRAGIAEQDPTELVYDREQIAAVVSAAGRAGVLCHAYSEEGIDGAVRAGVKSIEHGVFVGEATIARMARKGTYFTPTMAAITGMASSTEPDPRRARAAVHPGAPGGGPGGPRPGVTVVAGTDSFGTDVDPIGSEVRLLVEAGLPHLDAIRAATTNAARLLRWSDRVGRLVRGYRRRPGGRRRQPAARTPAAWRRSRSIVAQGAVVRRGAMIASRGGFRRWPSARSSR